MPVDAKGSRCSDCIGVRCDVRCNDVGEPRTFDCGATRGRSNSGKRQNEQQRIQLVR